METVDYSVLTCPRCGNRSNQEMPQNACIVFFRCPSCKTVLRPLSGDCCVFCSYGSVKCPPVQLQTNLEL
ncbi:MAG TPA: GDCCVxC domain-containing (seleno)protein [Nitrospira sp.]|nr:GDCCVxC domain-containing (seleno)protein [Nitrospira sp.]